MLDDLIREADVAWASNLMGLGPDGFAPVGDDDSRFRAMLTLDTADFESCPGSGKTTLLVAKLAILAMRWSDRQQGICVLSHTNAARNEIGAKLGNSAAGLALMRYPHFIGTIHSFVNEYLALPWLRSKGIEVRCIDTQIALQKRFSALPWKTRAALTHSNLGPDALIYTQSDYSGGSVGKFLPHTPTGGAIIEVRREVSERGYFCFDEMFVWANELLDRRPETARDLRQRFPLLFIDEAQDNSEEQSALLHRIFCEGAEPAIRQRFGDSNQAIYARSGLDGANTDLFPGEAVHDLPRSYRFGQFLADEVKGFGVTPQALVGAGPPPGIGDASKAPAIFLFDDSSVQSVLPAYGTHLLASFDQPAVASGVFAAVSGVHDRSEEDRIPRAMGHYAPTYDPSCARREGVPESFASYLARARFEMAGSSNSGKLVNAAAAGLLAASELVGAANVRVTRVTPHRRILGLLDGKPGLESYHALQELILSRRGEFSSDGWNGAGSALAVAVIKELAGTPMLSGAATDFLVWPGSPAPGDDQASIARTDNLFAFPSEAPQIEIRLGSIHSVKGETHTATLVLDSYFHGHHLSALKEWLLGTKSGGSPPNARGRPVDVGPRLRGRLKLHYVAMTRPTHMLCLAMRKDAFGEGEIDILAAKGWTVIDCCGSVKTGGV